MSTKVHVDSSTPGKCIISITAAGLWHEKLLEASSPASSSSSSPDSVLPLTPPLTPPKRRRGRRPNPRKRKVSQTLDQDASSTSGSAAKTPETAPETPLTPPDTPPLTTSNRRSRRRSSSPSTPTRPPSTRTRTPPRAFDEPESPLLVPETNADETVSPEELALRKREAEILFPKYMARYNDQRIRRGFKPVETLPSSNYQTEWGHEWTLCRVFMTPREKEKVIHYFQHDCLWPAERKKRREEEEGPRKRARKSRSWVVHEITNRHWHIDLWACVFASRNLSMDFIQLSFMQCRPCGHCGLSLFGMYAQSRLVLRLFKKLEVSNRPWGKLQQEHFEHVLAIE